jgi:hypothetical protein
MPRVNPAQLDHWLDEEIDLLVRSLETEADGDTAPPWAARNGGQAPVGALAAVRLARRVRGRLSARRGDLVFYAFAIAVSLLVGALIPLFDRL